MKGVKLFLQKNFEEDIVTYLKESFIFFGKLVFEILTAELLKTCAIWLQEQIISEEG
jgi:hypothetical protein